MLVQHTAGFKNGNCCNKFPRVKPRDLRLRAQSDHIPGIQYSLLCVSHPFLYEVINLTIDAVI